MYNLLKLRLHGRLYRYGHACVSFGEPLSLSQWQKANGVDFAIDEKEHRFAAVSRLADDLMTRIGKIIPALPVALVSTVLLEDPDTWMGELELKSRVFDLISSLEAKGAHVHIPRSDRDYAVGTGLRMLTLRHLAEENERGLFRANPKEQILLQYYANSIAHLLR
ncbi:MAG: hypothetical protein R3D29_07575 [Nitratireductor sp.]